MSDHLGRAYRRLLRAYPRGPRREEMLGTLLEAAPPGRRRPTVGEGFNLIRYGLRARLGYPRSTAVVVFSLLVALAGAYFGAAGGQRLGWEFAPALPSGVTAAEITGTVLPGLKVWGGGDAPIIVTQSDGEGVEYGFVTYWVRHTAATRDVNGYSTAAKDRMAAAGWQVHDYAYEPPASQDFGGVDSGATFWASRPGLVLGYSDGLYTGMPSYDSDGGVQLTLRRSEPSWLGWFGWTGAALGFLVIWFLAAWVCGRFYAVNCPGAIPGFLAGLLLVLLIPPMLVGSVPDPPGASPWWSGLMPQELFSGFLVLALGSVILLLGTAILAGPNPLRWAFRMLRPRPRVALAGAAVLVLGVAAVVLWPTSPAAIPLARPACHPAPGAPAEAPESQIKDSKAVHVYVDPASTPDQRNLITAAIRRSWAAQTDATFYWESDSAAFRDTYCDGAPIQIEAVPTLPYFFALELDVPGDYPALLQEVQGMPGVVSIARVRSLT